jgi:hypothetical protein
LGVGTEKRAPGEAGPPRRRRDPVPPQERADRGGGDAVPQLEQVPADALLAPAGVLPRQLQDQVAAGGRQRRAPWPATSAEHGPFAAHQLPVPA